MIRRRRQGRRDLIACARNLSTTLATSPIMSTSPGPHPDSGRSERPTLARATSSKSAQSARDTDEDELQPRGASYALPPRSHSKPRPYVQPFAPYRGPWGLSSCVLATLQHPTQICLVVRLALVRIECRKGEYTATRVIAIQSVDSSVPGLALTHLRVFFAISTTAPIQNNVHAISISARAPLTDTGHSLRKGDT